MKIWVDADACPVVIRENPVQGSRTDQGEGDHGRQSTGPCACLSTLEFVQVSPGFDVADNEIVNRAESGDLVITADYHWRPK